MMTSGIRRVAIPVLSVLALAVLGSVLAWSTTASRGQERSGVEWEYLIVAGGNVNFPGGGGPGKNKQKEFAQEAVTVERNLDRLGAEGWELVAVYGAPNNPTFYLKRAKQR